MIITIIGSLSRKDRMVECKEYWRNLGNVVNSPEEAEGYDNPLLIKQRLWYKKIEEADLVVAIPKYVITVSGDLTAFEYAFGESTSYEMAIAQNLKKQIVYWVS